MGGGENRKPSVALVGLFGIKISAMAHAHGSMRCITSRIQHNVFWKVTFPPWLHPVKICLHTVIGCQHLHERGRFHALLYNIFNTRSVTDPHNSFIFGTVAFSGDSKVMS